MPAKFARLVVALVTAAILTGTLAACNTMEGIGRDAKAAGEALSSSASKSKRY